MTNSTQLTNYGLGLDASLAELTSYPTPASTETCIRVPHIEVIEALQKSAEQVGIELDNFKTGTTHDYNRMFGICDVFYDKHNADYKSIMAFRNSTGHLIST